MFGTNFMLKKTQDISDIFKAEYSNLVAVLCRLFGIDNIQLAEDLISDTFVQAMKTWSHKGVPDEPKGWLHRVAFNKAKDHFRRNKTYKDKIIPHLLRDTDKKKNQPFSEELMADSQLNMFFAVCHSALSPSAQICLALRILCSFNIEEIAAALLSNKEAINKKLFRAKQKLKPFKKEWKNLNPNDYTIRLDNVLRIIYLIFNEGYYSSISNENIRQELCWEAMRLCLFLLDQESLPKIKINALMALMCFHTSRLNSRVDHAGNFILFDKQDRSLWNQELIQKGKAYLSRSADGKIVSNYHLEAAIAYWHTTDADDKWNNILQLYNKLLTIAYSPVAAMNRTFALAHANSVPEAIKEAKKLDLKQNHLYYSLMAELYKMVKNHKEELKFLKLALAHTEKEKEIKLLNRKIEIASRNKN